MFLLYASEQAGTQFASPHGVYNVLRHGSQPPVLPRDYGAKLEELPADQLETAFAIADSHYNVARYGGLGTARVLAALRTFRDDPFRSRRRFRLSLRPLRPTASWIGCITLREAESELQFEICTAYANRGGDIPCQTVVLNCRSLRSTTAKGEATVVRYVTHAQISRVLSRLGIDPASRLDPLGQDAEYTTCRVSELAAYLDLYTTPDTTEDDRRVLCCFMLECLNEVAHGEEKHSLESQVLQCLFADQALHADELAYWMDTADPDEGNWWPLTNSLLRYRNKDTS